MAEASASDTSLSAGSDFVSDTSLSAGSEFVFDNVCKPCRSEGKIAEAEKYCQDCREHLCAQCTGFHHKFSSLKDHKLVGSADAHKQIKATFVADIKVRTGFFSNFPSRSLSGINGLALVSIERLVAVKLDATGISNRLMLIDTTKKKRISEFKGECNLYDVTVCGGEVAATVPDDKKIIFLKCDDGLVYIRDLRVHGHCAALDCVDDKLYVVYDEEKKLEVMTVTGSVLQKFDKNGQGDDIFQNPIYVTVCTVNQSIYVSDYETDELIVLGLDGKVKGRYKDCSDMGEFRQLAVDATTGVMYLCDIYNDTIHLLSPQCEKVKLLLTEKDGLQAPSSVCYCGSTRRLYVGMATGIKIYQIS